MPVWLWVTLALCFDLALLAVLQLHAVVHKYLVPDAPTLVSVVSVAIFVAIFADALMLVVALCTGWSRWCGAHAYHTRCSQVLASPGGTPC